MFRSIVDILNRVNLFKNVDFGKSDYDDPESRTPTTVLDEATMATSLLRKEHQPLMREAGLVPIRAERHYVMVDLDMPAYVVPSSTPGHCHLYISHEVRWDDYVELLRAMAKCGLVEEGYVKASERRGFTSLRTPWTKKESAA